MQRFLRVTLVLLCALGCSTSVQADPPQSAKQRLIDKVCNLIQAHADQNGLPRDFFARLIWKESRFDPNAVSPVGAEGIAQFMPGTAKMRGLENSFDINQAIPASAKYLAEMKTSYGNLGLAAAQSFGKRAVEWCAGAVATDVQGSASDVGNVGAHARAC